MAAASSSSWLLRCCRRIHAPAMVVRPPCAPIQAPVIGREIGCTVREAIQAPVIGSEIEAPGAESAVDSMELMACPKRKVSPYKRKMRNMHKRLKPIPVIAQCR